MEKINQNVRDVLSQIQSQFGTVDTSLQSADPETVEAGASKNADGVQLWQTSQQLSEMVSTMPQLEAEQPPLIFQNMTESPAIDSKLPAEEILRELVELFFELIYPWIPLFHKPNFVANLLLPERKILLHGIVLTTFRFWSKPTPPAEMRDNYVRISREQILLSTIDTCSLISTQALALLAVDAIGQGTGARTCNLMAMLIAASKQMGLARGFSAMNNETNTSLVRNEDPEDNLDLSSIEMEEKRRLFWTIYSLDRFSSVSHGQSCGIDTKTIKLPYPVRDKSWGQLVASEWFHGAVMANSAHVHCLANLWHHYIDLLAFMDRSNQFLIQPVNFSLAAQCQEWQRGCRHLDITLTSWFENLPTEVREPPAVFDPMWTMLHATFYLYASLIS